ncbi:MAG: glycyl-radical enzyme activating protein [Firmicutes bacterium]|nr:glycyl-radical enzyme activating protein [Bacillota bacterium]
MIDESAIVNYTKKGIVFNIQKFSIHDGPGVRSIVFIKGCPLSCKWCSNPESQDGQPIVMFNEKNCIHCGKCLTVCTHHAIDSSVRGLINRKLCVNCGYCATICPAQALIVSGKSMSVREVIQEIKKDAIMYRRSNGGITVSGGEPLFQADFVAELLKACKLLGWHTAIETTGYASVAQLEKVLPFVDTVLFDIKNIESESHLDGTGKTNELILANALRIAITGSCNVVVRVPLVPNFNANPRCVHLICEFVKYMTGVKEIHLLPYHKLGANKYELLGREYPIDDALQTPEEEDVYEYKKIVEEHGFRCIIGG